MTSGLPRFPLGGCLSGSAVVEPAYPGEVAKVTMKTVAQKVGVSVMTVSNAFARPDQLSAALRERVLATAAELGYEGPDPAARTLARGRTNTVGVLPCWSSPDVFGDDFYSAFLGSVSRELATRGYGMTLLPHAVDGGAPVLNIAMDGAIVFDRAKLQGGLGLDSLVRRGVPVAFVDQAPDVADFSVNVDDFGGARLGAQHVVDLGHRRIATANAGPEGTTSIEASGWHTSEERQRGRLEVLDAAGIVPLTAYRHISSVDNGMKMGFELLDRPADERPTAVLCDSDAFAAGVLQAAYQLGLTVPQDLSIVGFDDTALAREVRPALTTVRQDITAKGKAVTDLLLKQMDAARSNTVATPEHVLLPTELVVRDSTGPAPA